MYNNPSPQYQTIFCTGYITLNVSGFLISHYSGFSIYHSGFSSVSSGLNTLFPLSGLIQG